MSRFHSFSSTERFVHEVNKVLDTYPDIGALSSLAQRDLAAFESARADLFALTAAGHAFPFTIIRRLEALGFSYPTPSSTDRLSLALLIVDIRQQMELLSDTRDMVADHIVSYTSDSLS